MNYLRLFFLTSIIFLTLACKKEELKPNNNNYVEEETEHQILDIDWVLVSGRIYIENINTNEKTYYNHFGSTQMVSVLDPINGAAIPFDTITEGVTTFRFNSNGKFVLNGNKFYDLTHTNNTFNAIGMENGSARPMTVIDINKTSLSLKVNEDYASDGTSLFKMYTTLTFVKMGSVCNNCEPDAYYGWTYGGVISYNNTTPSVNTPTDIINTKWVITRVNKGFTNEYPNDTLYFMSNGEYTINSGTIRQFTLTTTMTNMMSLSLYSCTTLNGDYSGEVINTFIQDGEINSVNFKPIISSSNSDAKVWMVRIQ